MTNGQIIGDGTSRKLRATFPATYEEFRQKAASAELTLDILMNLPGWSIVPTMLTKDNLLKAVTEKRLSLPDDSSVDDALSALIQKVGDLYPTILTNVGDKYLLCNGAQIAGGNPEYEELYKLLPFKDGSSTGSISVPDNSYREIVTGANMVSDHYVIAKRRTNSVERHKLFLKIIDKSLKLTTKVIENGSSSVIMNDTASISYFNGYCVVFYTLQGDIWYSYSSDFTNWKSKNTGKQNTHEEIYSAVIGDKLVFMPGSGASTSFNGYWISDLENPRYTEFDIRTPRSAILSSVTASENTLYVLFVNDDIVYTKAYIASSTDLSSFKNTTLDKDVLGINDFGSYDAYPVLSYTNGKLILVTNDNGDADTSGQSVLDSGILLVAKDKNDMSKGFDNFTSVRDKRKQANISTRLGAQLAGKITYSAKDNYYIVPFYSCVIACSADFKSAIILKPLEDYVTIRNDYASDYGKPYEGVLTMDNVFGVPTIEANSGGERITLWEYVKGYTLPTVSLQGAHVYIRAKE